MYFIFFIANWITSSFFHSYIIELERIILNIFNFLNKGKEILTKKNDIEEGLEHPLTIVIEYPSQDELDKLV